MRPLFPLRLIAASALVCAACSAQAPQAPQAPQASGAPQVQDDYLPPPDPMRQLPRDTPDTGVRNVTATIG
ncbi:MAG: PQQ-dependent sugar dehydrogenase, partial [Sphingomonas sp.]